MSHEIAPDSTAAQGGTPAAASAPITALPALSDLEIAHGKIEELTRELETTRGDLAAAAGDRERLRLELADLQKQIAEVDENPFVFVLRSIDAGSVLEEAGNKIRELFSAARKLEGKGTFTLGIGVKPYDGKSDALVYAAKLKLKLPDNDPAPELAWVDEENGTISRHDPRQRRFDFAEDENNRRRRKDSAPQAD